MKELLLVVIVVVLAIEISGLINASPPPQMVKTENNQLIWE